MAKAEARKEPVLVDTSVWIAFFRGTEPHAGTVAQILKDQRVVTTGIIKAEIIQGVKSDKEAQRVLEVLAAIESMEISDGLWVKSGWLVSKLRGKGSAVPLTDAAIGTLALEYGLSVYTLDKHYDVMPGLKIYRW
jgi:predicted nucleic acid-binding protein